MNQIVHFPGSFTVAVASVLLIHTLGQSASPEIEKEAEQKFLALKKQLPEMLTKFVKDSKSFDIDFAVAAGLPLGGAQVKIEGEGELKLARRTGPSEAKVTIA